MAYNRTALLFLIFFVFSISAAMAEGKPWYRSSTYADNQPEDLWLKHIFLEYQGSLVSSTQKVAHHNLSTGTIFRKARSTYYFDVMVDQTEIESTSSTGQQDTFSVKGHNFGLQYLIDFHPRVFGGLFAKLLRSDSIGITQRQDYGAALGFVLLQKDDAELRFRSGLMRQDESKVASGVPEENDFFLNTLVWHKTFNNKLSWDLSGEIIFNTDKFSKQDHEFSNRLEYRFSEQVSGFWSYQLQLIDQPKPGYEKQRHSNGFGIRCVF